MLLNTRGLVIREQTVKENDRIITVLTADHGIIRSCVYGAKKLQSRLEASTQLFSYAEFSFSKKGEYYTVDHAVTKEIFFELRNNIENIAIAQYFAQLEEELATAGEDGEEYLRLMLNSLHMLSSKSRPINQIKAIFEMRIITLAGYMPDITMCENCGKYEDDIFYFDIEKGTIKCPGCSDKKGIEITGGMLHAMRHICYSDFEKIFSFSLSDEGLERLSKLTEAYLQNKVGRKFKTLEFYYSLV